MPIPNKYVWFEIKNLLKRVIVHFQALITINHVVICNCTYADLYISMTCRPAFKDFCHYIFINKWEIICLLKRYVHARPSKYLQLKGYCMQSVFVLGYL